MFTIAGGIVLAFLAIAFWRWVLIGGLALGGTFLVLIFLTWLNLIHPRPGGLGYTAPQTGAQTGR